MNNCGLAGTNDLYNYNPDEIKQYRNFQCNKDKDQYLIYFDHKIADSLSTLQKFILFGSYPSESCKLTSMLNNCTIRDNAEFNKEICKSNITDLNDEKYNTYICIKTFYKAINYESLQNDILDKSLTLVENYYKFFKKSDLEKKYIKYKIKYFKSNSMI
jgi:hypothetical protein